MLKRLFLISAAVLAAVGCTAKKEAAEKAPVAVSWASLGNRQRCV